MILSYVSLDGPENDMKADMKINMKTNKKGFTLAELLIVVAIIGVLVAISIPIFITQLERSREATDLANVRSAYAQVMAAAITGDTASVDYKNGVYSLNVSLNQKQDGWQTKKSLTIGGVSQTDTAHWFGTPGNKGTCTVYYSEEAYTTAQGNAVPGNIAFEWAGGTASGEEGGESGGSDSGEGTPVQTVIAGLGDFLSRLGGGWGADSNSGLMSIGGASSAESASKVTLTTTPVALSDGAEVTITSEDGYQTGYFLMKYDAEKGGYVKVVDSGWKKGTFSFKVDGDGYYLVTNTKKNSGNISIQEAEENASISITGNKALDTTGMTGTALTDMTDVSTKVKTALNNSTNSKTGGTVTESSAYYRGCASVAATQGQILSLTGSEDYNYAYFFVNKDNTVLFDSGWLGYNNTTAIEVPQDCTVLVQVQRTKEGMTEDALNTALKNVSIYSK